MEVSAYEEVCIWEKTEAVQILQKCELEKGMIAMDLGCGSVHYTIPAAIAVSSKGKVIAVDYDKKVIKPAYDRLTDAAITNVELVCANHLELKPIPDGSIDFLMLYDMIHTNPRTEIYSVVKHLLKKGGILSFLAFGEIRIRKNPEGQLIKSDKGKNITDTYEDALKHIQDEIIGCGFELVNIVENDGVHFDHFHSPYHWKKYGDVRLKTLERGNIYNYKKL